MDRRFELRNEALLEECQVSPSVFRCMEQRLARFVEPYASCLVRKEQRRHAETIVVQVLPSTIDIQATKNFLKELASVGKIERKEAKFGVVANRFREYTLICEELDEYLASSRVPYLAALREAQNYVRAYTRGLGIHELPEYLAWPDWEQWDPLVKWLKSVRSQP